MVFVQLNRDLPFTGANHLLGPKIDPLGSSTELRSALKTVMLRSLENSSNPGRAPGCRASEHVELFFVHRRKGLH